MEEDEELELLLELLEDEELELLDELVEEELVLLDDELELLLVELAEDELELLDELPSGFSVPPEQAANANASSTNKYLVIMLSPIVDLYLSKFNLFYRNYSFTCAAF